MKHTSKRRWIARFFIGRPIPFLILTQYPELPKRLFPHGWKYYGHDTDAIIYAPDNT